MANGFAVTPAALRDVATQLGTIADDAHRNAAVFSGVQNQLEAWIGPAADDAKATFSEHERRLRASADTLYEGYQLLHQAGDRIGAANTPRPASRMLAKHRNHDEDLWLRQVNDKLHGIEDIEKRLNTIDPGHREAFLLAIDGSTIIAAGNPDTATYVPGTGANLSKVGGDLHRAGRTYDVRGPDPAAGHFGAHVFGSDPGAPGPWYTDGYSGEAHSQYWDPNNSALINMD